MKIDLKANEVVLKATDSEYVLQNMPINGKLILTNQRIYFKTEKMECDQYNLEILPTDLREILPFKQGWFSAKGLTLVTKEGKTMNFVIKKRNEWEVALNKIY